MTLKFPIRTSKQQTNTSASKERAGVPLSLSRFPPRLPLLPRRGPGLGWHAWAGSWADSGGTRGEWEPPVLGSGGALPGDPHFATDPAELCRPAVRRGGRLRPAEVISCASPSLAFKGRAGSPGPAERSRQSGVLNGAPPGWAPLGFVPYGTPQPAPSPSRLPRPGEETRTRALRTQVSCSVAGGRAPRVLGCMGLSGSG